MEWQISTDGKSISREWAFHDFDEAMIFVNKVSEIARTQSHHPDILVNYKKVALTLTTHSAGGLTEKDEEMARLINNL